MRAVRLYFFYSIGMKASAQQAHGPGSIIMNNLHSLIVLPLLCLCSLALASDELSDAPSCISVEINGSRSPSYDCLSRMMAPQEDTASGSLPQFDSAAVVNRGGNQLGLFNRAATQIRMGSNFGHSVYPNTPARTSPPNPLVPR